MSEVTETQKLESQILALKARLFDVQEIAQQAQETSRLLQETLSKIAAKVGVTGESVTLADLVDAVPEVNQVVDEEVSE